MLSPAKVSRRRRARIQAWPGKSVNRCSHLLCQLEDDDQVLEKARLLRWRISGWKNSALLTSASSQDCYIKEEEEEKISYVELSMYLQLFVTAALPVLSNTNKKGILQ